MSDWLAVTDRDLRNALGAAASLPPLAVRPSSATENLEAAWDLTWSENASISEALSLTEHWQAYLDHVETLTGERLDNPAYVLAQKNDFFRPVETGLERLGNLASEALFDRPMPMSHQGRYRNAAASIRHRVADLARSHPDLPVKGHDEILRDAAAAAKAIRDRAAEVRAGADTWGDIAYFAGGAGAAVLDPPNLATMWAGAPAAAHLLRTFLIEAGLGAAVEAGALPAVAQWKHDIGADFGVGDALENVTMGALGAGGLSVSMKLMGRGFTGLLDAWKQARLRGQVPDTPETRAAEQVLDQASAVMEESPFDDSIEGQAAHLRMLEDTERALMEGRPLSDEGLRTYRAHLGARIDRMVAKATGADTGEDVPDSVVYSRLTRTQAVELEPGAAPHLPDGSSLATAVRRIDGQAVRKILKDHGRDEVPFRPEHFRLIPDVVETGQLVGVGPKDGRLGILWRARVDGDWLYVAESIPHVGTAKPPKRLTLNVQTAYWASGPKEKGPVPTGGLRPRQPFHVPDPPPEGRPAADARGDRDGPASTTIHPDDAWGKGGPAPDEGVAAHSAPGRDGANPAPTIPRRAKSLPESLREPSRRPETLMAWIHRQGGLRDDGGEMAHMGIRPGAPGVRPGTVNRRGMDFDTALKRAVEDGFFPGADYRDLTIADFLDAIRDDFEGRPRHRHLQNDADLMAEWDAYRRNWEEVDRLGIDPRGMTDADLLRALREAVRLPTPDEVRSVLDEMDAARPDLERALYRDVARLVEDDPDFTVDFEARHPDGTTVAGTATAADLMRAADADIEAVATFRACALGDPR